MKPKMIAKLLITALLIYGAMLVFLFFYQRNLMYFPDRSRPDPASYGVPGIEIATAATEDGLALQGWYFPPRENKPVIAYFHGNASNFANRLPKIGAYLNAGYGVLLAEYRGYGGNPGAPSEQGLYKDARAFLQWLTQQKQIPPARIVLYGESIGSGPAVQMASETAPAALVLEAPLSSASAMARRSYPYVPVNLLLRDRYDNLSKIGRIKTPLLIVTGEKDTIIPPAHSRAVFEAASDPRYYVTLPGAGHNDMAEYGLENVVLEFLGALDFSGDNDKNPEGQ